MSLIVYTLLLKSVGLLAFLLAGLLFDCHCCYFVVVTVVI